jgi:hypothetical protein
MFVAFFIAKSSVMCQNHKKDASSLFQSQTSIFHDEEPSFTPSPGAKKARTMLQSSPKSTMVTKKTKKMTDKQTKKQTHWYAKISKFKKFKNSILTHIHAS